MTDLIGAWAEANGLPDRMPERPLYERALSSLGSWGHRLPLAAVDLISAALRRLGALERAAAQPPKPGIQVKVAPDLDVMSLDDLCLRFNQQRRTIEHLLAGRARTADKLTEILKNIQEEPWTGA